MRNLIWLILVMLFTSSCNKDEKEIKALKENGIYELKYLKEYAHDYSPDSLIVNTRHFNYLYNSLHLVNAKDSSVLFFTDYEEGFLLRIRMDSIEIYRRETGAVGTETSTWRDIQTLFFDMLEKVEYKQFDSLNIYMEKNYKNLYELKQWYQYKYSNEDKVKFEGIWESIDKIYFVDFIYSYCIGEMCQFKYEKTIKNEFLPLSKYKIVTPAPRRY